MHSQRWSSQTFKDRECMQGAPKNEEWAGWEGAAAKEEKTGPSNDDWGKW